MAQLLSPPRPPPVCGWRSTRSTTQCTTARCERWLCFSRDAASQRRGMACPSPQPSSRTQRPHSPSIWFARRIGGPDVRYDPLRCRSCRVRDQFGHGCAELLRPTSRTTLQTGGNASGAVSGSLRTTRAKCALTLCQPIRQSAPLPRRTRQASCSDQRIWATRTSLQQIAFGHLSMPADACDHTLAWRSYPACLAP